MPSFILLLIVVQFYLEHNHFKKSGRIKIHNKKDQFLMLGKINQVSLVKKNFFKHYFMYPF